MYTIAPELFNSRLPREQFKFFRELTTKETLLSSFKKDPIAFFKNYGIDTSELILPKDFELPPHEELVKRMNHYFGDDDFCKPAAIMSAAGFVIFVVFLAFLLHGDTPA